MHSPGCFVQRTSPKKGSIGRPWQKGRANTIRRLQCRAACCAGGPAPSACIGTMAQLLPGCLLAICTCWHRKSDQIHSSSASVTQQSAFTGTSPPKAGNGLNAAPSRCIFPLQSQPLREKRKSETGTPQQPCAKASASNERVRRAPIPSQLPPTSHTQRCQAWEYRTVQQLLPGCLPAIFRHSVHDPTLWRM